MAELNTQQLSVVDAPINDDLVVIAGAGTGKTRVIVSRIQKLLSDPSVSPNQILAISFSRDTKKELDDRLRRELGPIASQIQVSTFNALGLKIISQYKQQAGLTPQVKTRTEYDLCREFKKFFNEVYKFFPYVQAPEDENSSKLSVLAANANNDKDSQLAQTMCFTWNNILQNGSTLPSKIQNMQIDWRLFAQDFNLVFPKSIAPHLPAQYKHFLDLSAMPQWSNSCHGVAQVHRQLLHNTLEELDKLTQFTLVEQWKAVLMLNHGSLDVLGGCWQEISMLHEHPQNLGNEYHRFAFCSERYTFSLKELYDYVSKRKETGALPRIGSAKFEFYSSPLNFIEAWHRAYPCDLMRLKGIAPERMQSTLKCPFGKDLTKTLHEADVEALQETIESVESQHDDDKDSKKNTRDDFYKLFIKGEPIKEVIADAKDCSCTFCPFFLDWYELLFAMYEQWREDANYLDFPEQINRCVRLLAGFDSIKRIEQQKVRFIFVDEFQDTNNVQYELLCKLKLSDNLPPEMQNHLCVVGDDDQSIYGWRGANFRCLKDINDYLGRQGSNFLSLTINYRSHQNILNLANSLVRNNRSRLMQKRLVCPLAFEYERSQPEHKEVGYDSSAPRVNIVGINSYQLEGIAVAQAITYLHNYMGVPYNEIAVLFRINHLSAGVEFALLQQNIPYNIKEQAFATRASVRDALAALRLALDPHDDEAFILVACCLFRKKVEKLIYELQNTQLKHIKKHNPQVLDDVPAVDVLSKDKQGKGKAGSHSVKMDELLERARSNSQFAEIPSLYQLVNETYENSQRRQPKAREQDIIKILLPLCERIDDAQTWHENSSLADNLLLILTKLSIKEHYQRVIVVVASDGNENNDILENDEWSNIVQLISIAETFVHSINEDAGLVQSKAANNEGAISVGALATTPNFTGNAASTSGAVGGAGGLSGTSMSGTGMSGTVGAPHHDAVKVATAPKTSHQPVSFAEFVDRYNSRDQDQFPHGLQYDPRGLSSDDLLKKELEQAKIMDPMLDKELETYSEKIALMRSQARKMIIQLDQHCGAPWAPPLRVLYDQLKLQSSNNNDKVNLLSIHGSKGKEFQAVIIIGFEKDILPYYSSFDNHEQLEEERRLAYVAITRAKRYLLVTFCRNRLTKLQTTRDTGRSIFVNEALQDWKNLDVTERPYQETLIKGKDFFDQDNVWMGRIDP